MVEPGFCVPLLFSVLLAASGPQGTFHRRPVSAAKLGTAADTALGAGGTGMWRPERRCPPPVSLAARLVSI